MPSELDLDAPAGRRAPPGTGTVSPARIERRPPAVLVEERKVLRPAARAHAVQVVVREHRREENDVDVTAPRRIRVASLARDVLPRVHGTDIEASSPVLDADEHRGHIGYGNEIGEVLCAQKVLAGPPFKLDAPHQLAPVELVDRRGLRWDEDEEA